MSHRSAQILVVTVFLLLALGITMLCSTSVFDAGTPEDDIYYDVKRQFVWVLMGGVACIMLAVLDYHWWQRTAWVWYGIAAVALLCCFLPGIGMKINGEYRWISAKAAGLPELRFQPSELAKLAVIIALAGWFSRHSSEEKTFVRGFAIPAVIAGVLAMLILAEVDMGSAVILGATAFTIMYLAGSNWKYLGTTCLAAMAGLAVMVYTIPNRMVRITALFDLEKHKMDAGLQQHYATLAFGSGGTGGLGLGNGRLKMLYMPFAHTDFIFPMIGEELGLYFTLGVVLGFVLIIIFGMLIASHAPDRFGKLLGTGIVCCIAIQALLNIGVTTAVLPNTGLPLPFVSYGGSNILFCMVGVGILLNIFRQGNQSEGKNYPKILRTKLTPRV